MSKLAFRERMSVPNIKVCLHMKKIWRPELSQSLPMMKYFNLYDSLGKFSRRQLNIFFYFFLRKQDSIVHVNCLHWFQPMCMNCQILFSGGKGKILHYVDSRKFFIGDNLHELLNSVFLKKKNDKYFEYVVCWFFTHLIRLDTVCNSVIDLRLKASIPLFTTMGVSKLKDGKFQFINSRVKGLIELTSSWYSPSISSFEFLRGSFISFLQSRGHLFSISDSRVKTSWFYGMYCYVTLEQFSSKVKKYFMI